MTFTILVPLDGSPLAERALPFASSLASAVSGRLILAHVTPPAPTPGAPAYDSAAVVAALREEGVSVESRVYRAWPDEIADALLGGAAEERADLVAMSTHGRGGLTRWVLGSVADQLVRRATLPVLLVPPHCDVEWTTRRPDQILVPLDGSPLAEEAIEPAAWLAERVGAEMLLVRVLSPALHARYHQGRLVLSSADFAELEDVWHYLDDLAHRVRTAGHRVSIWVVEGSPSAAITDAARSEGMDLIAMTTHGRGGLRRILLGSIADAVLRQSTVPILLVRSGVASLPTRERVVPDELASAVAAVSLEMDQAPAGDGTSVPRTCG